MAPNQDELRSIRPTPPDETVRELLTLTSAQVLPLSAGGGFNGRVEADAFWLITAVRGSFAVASQTRYSVLYPGQVLALHSYGDFSIHSVTEGLCVLVEMQGELPERLLGGKLYDGAALFSHGMSAIRGSIAAMTVMEEEDPPVEGNAASAYGYVMLMTLLSARAVSMAENNAPRVSRLVAAAGEIIQEEFATLQGLDELAKRLGVSKAHLIRTYTRETGISPGKYINRVRVEYAKILLRNEENSITYVAKASGFSSANYFAKAFRRETGMSPSDYVTNLPQQR